MEARSKTMRRPPALALVLLLTLPLAASAQLPARADSSLRAIFGGRGGGGGGVRFGPAKWSSSGDAYTTIEASAARGPEIVEYDAATGTRTVKVTAAQLTP